MNDEQPSATPDPGLTELLAAEQAAGQRVEQLLPAELPPVDLATLLGELTALKAEVRAETRAARDTREQLSAALEMTREELRRAASREAQLAEQLERLRREAGRNSALLLAELRERLAPALRQAQGLKPPRHPVFPWRQLPADPVAAALAEGLALTLGRIDHQLTRQGVQAVAAIGDRFDPGCMEAVEAQVRPELAEGTVLSVVQEGWRDGAGLIRTARVVVSRQGRGSTG